MKPVAPVMDGVLVASSGPARRSDDSGEPGEPRVQGGALAQGRSAPGEGSDLSSALGSDEPDTVEIGALIDRLGHKAHGTVLLLLAVPNLIPIPIVPASTTVFGALIALIGAQLVAGRAALWLPARVRSYRVALQTAHTWLERADKLTGQLAPAPDGPRRDCPEDNPGAASSSSRARGLDRAVGALAIVQGLILALPIPFANMLPALSVACLGAGLARANRRALMAGVALALVTLVVLLSMSRWLTHLWRTHSW